jgi:predicted O-linked N-acetylglucosamine transferase (SPINDLY family)
MELLPPDYHLGVRYHRAGDLAQAEASYRRALEQDPSQAWAWHLLGVLAMQRGDSALALELIQYAIRLESTKAAYHSNLGAVLRSVGRLAEAEASLRLALRLQPDFTNACCNLGLVLADQNRADEAVPWLQQALRLQGDYIDAGCGLAHALTELGRVDDARAALQWVLQRSPRPSLRVSLATLLPLVYRSVADLHESRQRLIDEVDRLVAEGVVIDLDTQPATPVFALAHQGMNDRAVQRQLARLYRAPAEPSVPNPRERDPDGPIRVGFISTFFSNHTIGKLTRGVIGHLARPEFHVTVLAVGGAHEDASGRFIRDHADHFIEVSRHLPTARAQIVGADLDILFYTDLGMDSTTYSLAFSRLAPVQCATWGHPVTTGIDSIDYFVSSEILEPAGAEDHYTETLVRLRTLPFYYYRPEPPQPVRGRDFFGLSESAHLYACPQSIYKFHPEFDPILADILRRDPQGRLVMIRWAYVQADDLLRQRWATVMPEVLDRIDWLSRLQPPEYLSLLAVSDVVLDPIHFGGGNTSWEAFAVGTPIVTLPSGFLRGRITLALYERMGIRDAVAEGTEHYVSLAVRLGTDPGLRRHLRERIQSASPLIFEDLEAVREMERFLRWACHRSPGTER